MLPRCPNTSIQRTFCATRLQIKRTLAQLYSVRWYANGWPTVFYSASRELAARDWSDIQSWPLFCDLARLQKSMSYTEVVRETLSWYLDSMTQQNPLLSNDKFGYKCLSPSKTLDLKKTFQGNRWRNLPSDRNIPIPRTLSFLWLLETHTKKSPPDGVDPNQIRFLKKTNFSCTPGDEPIKA